MKKDFCLRMEFIFVDFELFTLCLNDFYRVIIIFKTISKLTLRYQNIFSLNTNFFGDYVFLKGSCQISILNFLVFRISHISH